MIVVGGEALVDLVIDPDGSVTTKLGGGPFNAARAIGRLDSDVVFLGALSSDRFGTLLHRQLVSDAVSDSLVQFTELPTTLAAAELDERGAATYYFYLSGTAAPSLMPAPLPAGVRILHVGTLGLVLEPMATTLEAVVDGVGDAVLVLLDPNCRPRVTYDRPGYLNRLRRMLRRADVVKVSSDDLDFIAPEDHSSGVRMLLEGGAALVLHTDGAHSVHVHSALGEVEVPVPRVEVVDTIGAGDAFGGAFAAWWDQAGLRRGDLTDRDAARAAVAAAIEVAAVSCTRVGAQPPRRAELGGSWNPTRP
jgi:fructokinase